MNNLESELTLLINQDKVDFSSFILKILNDEISKERKISELIKFLPIIISHTNNDNVYWLDIIRENEFLKDKLFLNIFLDNINKFDFQNSNFIIYKILNGIINYRVLDRNKQLKLIDKLFECDCSLDFRIIKKLWINLDDLLSDYIMNKCIESDKNCDALISFMLNRYFSYNYIDFIIENIDLILKNVKNTDNLFEVLARLKSADIENEEVISKIKNKIEENNRASINRLIKRIYIRLVGGKKIILDDEAQKKLETALEVFYLIIKDICRNENSCVSDLGLIGEGCYCVVFELGDKVIKISRNRGTKTFPNNPYINAILFRHEFIINDIYSLFIEVNEKVDTKINISEEELYQLYKKLRDINLIWADVAERNVGILLKDNKVYWQENLPLTDKVLGLQPYRGDELLKKGDFVILDNDLIYDEEDFIVGYGNYLYESFEERYKSEKKLNNKLLVEKDSKNTKKAKMMTLRKM